MWCGASAEIFETSTAVIIGVASGIGAPDQGCAEGPYALRYAETTNLSRRDEGSRCWLAILTPTGAPQPSDPIAAIAELARRIARLTEDLTAKEIPFVTVGGDHSCAIGTWYGAARGLGVADPLGLIWIDAHLDSHIPSTSPSGTIHGMPLASLLGFGDTRLTRIGVLGPAVQPAHVCLIGARSFEPEETALLDRLGVRIFMMEEVARRGLKEVFDEAVKIVGRGTAGFGVSIDLDAVDPLDAPGVGSPEPHGIRGHHLIAELRRLSRSPRLIGTEIAEFNPGLDQDGKTAGLILNLMAAVAPHGVRVR